ENVQAAATAHSRNVREGKRPQGRERQDLPGADAQWKRSDLHRPQQMPRRESWREVGQVCGKTDRGSANRCCKTGEKAGQSAQVSPERAERFTKINIFSAGFGKR